ncbi:MAG: hypothetical protein KME64_37785 [Scytonematopsis contorta HA4267-MV1]|nr:hypothetical protein [Scytonematopsis contorta HA4267-MV1]
MDDDWVSAGSANFDPRSCHHNDELNVSTSNPQLIEKINDLFVDALTNSHCLKYTEWENCSIIERIQGQVGLIFKPLL